MTSALDSSGVDRSGIVVIADDDPDVREVLAARFRGLGYEVVTARDGTEALAVLDALPSAEAVFVDLLMPGVIGTSVLDFIRNDERFAKTHVAVVSGSPELAPSDFRLFVKPVKFATLLEFIASPDPRAARRSYSR